MRCRRGGGWGKGREEAVGGDWLMARAACATWVHAALSAGKKGKAHAADAVLLMMMLPPPMLLIMLLMQAVDHARACDTSVCGGR